MERLTIENIKKSIQCCYDKDCVDCPNNEELGSGDIVCLGRLLSKIESCINNLQHQLAVKDKALELACERIKNMYEQERQYCTNEIPNFVEVEKVYFVEQAEKELKDDKTRID